MQPTQTSKMYEEEIPSSLAGEFHVGRSGKRKISTINGADCYDIDPIYNPMEITSDHNLCALTIVEESNATQYNFNISIPRYKDNESGPSNFPNAAYVDFQSKKMYFLEAQQPESIFFDVTSPDFNFVGRTEELQQLQESMQNLQTAKAATTAVSGLGGIGKTQLVRKIIEEYQSSYKNVIWINSESKELVNDSFKRLAEDRLKISIRNADGSEQDSESVIDSVLRQLSKTKTLFVYDNVLELEVIEFVCKRCMNIFNVIITSRIYEWYSEIKVIKLKVWMFDDAIKYVSTMLNDPTDSDGDKSLLVKKLQNFPLALKQATAHINHLRKIKRFRIADYIDQYDTHEMLDSCVFQKTGCNFYDKTIFSTWRVTIDTIERDGDIGRLAVRILQIIAYFDHEKIHKDFFSHLSHKADYRFIKFLPSHLQQMNFFKPVKIDHRSAIRLLENYSMIDSQEHESILSINKLVQVVIKLTLKETKMEKNILQDSLKLISNVMPGDSDGDSHSHAISVFLYTLEFPHLVKEFSSLPTKILSSLIEHEEYNRAMTFGDKVLQPLRKILGAKHEVTLNCEACIAYSFRKHVHFPNTEPLKMFKDFLTPEALERYQDVFEKQKYLLVEDYPDTLRNRSRMAYAFRELGKHSEALEMYGDVLEEQTITLGEHHPYTLATKCRMAYSSKELGKHTEALQIYRDVLEKQQYILGEDHPDTLFTRSNTAESYHLLGMFHEALQIYQQVFEKQKNILGKDHPDTLKNKSRMAYTLNELGRHSEALEIYREVLEKQQYILGEDHPDTLSTRSNTAELYHQLGKYDDALDIYQQVFEKQRKILGEDHLETLITISNIADLYQELGKITDALQMYQKVFEKQKHILGEEHPDTLRNRSRIANAFRELGKHSEALEMYRDIFQKQKHILGENHPDTLICKSNIAYSYRELGMHVAALRMYESIFEKQKIILGENHPETLACKSNIAHSREDLGMNNEAFQLYQGVFDKLNNILGADHPDTLICKASVAGSYKKLGRHIEALKIYQEVYEKVKFVLGENHRFTLITRCNIAGSNKELGNHTQALQIYREVLMKQKNILGEEHPMTLLTRSNIANSYFCQGLYDEALEIYQDVFEKQRNILGEEHPHTSNTRHNIYRILHS